MCAIEAGQRGRRVVVVEHMPQVGEKILISGGGRCNFTNLHTTPENFLSRNPHFAKSALARYTPRDFIALVERHGIPYHEKTLGQLFCDRSASEIVRMLEAECAAAGSPNRRRRAAWSSVSISRRGSRWRPASADRRNAASLVIATGGLLDPENRAPRRSATSMARQFGLASVECRAGAGAAYLRPRQIASVLRMAGVSAAT